MLEKLTAIVSFFSDSVSLVLGLIALYALIFHREKISAFGRILAHTLVGERMKKIKGALARLDSLNFEVKEDKREILALLGELAGMIRLLGDGNAQFKVCYDELIRFADGLEQLSEPKKRRLSEQLHALLDEQTLGAAITLLKEHHGPKSD
ncbi:MAG: hypothetical protein KF715_18120 [Candidatus Didemnitutus sp.]|nr:hypothetical protein [Candidatus Didemnitutus sp.]